MAISATRSPASSPAMLDISAKFFRALGDPTRLKILGLLLEGEKSVGELVDKVGAGQGRVSSHLACLRQCGLAVARREGKFVYYGLASEEVRDILEVSRKMVARNAEAIWECTRVRSAEEET